MFRYGDEVNMIVHEAVSPDPNELLDALFREHFDINAAIAVVHEDVRFPITTLRDMVGVSRQSNSMRP